MAKKFGQNFNPMADQPDEDDKPDLDLTKALGEQVLERTYGKLNVPNEEDRKIAKPISLDKITPDPVQARMTIPVSIQQIAQRDGITEWDAWHRLSERMTGRTIDLPALLKGDDIPPTNSVIVEGLPVGAEPKDPEIVKTFLELVGLAASIYHDGLINPISVVQVPGIEGRYQIESGEGRWWAHRILLGVLKDKQWSKIPALVMSEFSEWRQANENTSRRDLNAISRTRQLARLIMALNRANGVTYLPYAEIVKPGQSNQAFYAQVADGYKHKIPDGDIERVAHATGLKKRSRIAQYRALLRLPEDKWIQGDEENLTEGDLRPFVPTKPTERSMFTGVNINKGKSGDSTFTHVNVNGGSSAPAPLTNAPGGPMRYALEGEGRRWATYKGQRVQVERSVGVPLNGMRVWLLDEQGERTRSLDVEMRTLSDFSNTIAPSAPSLPPVSYGVIGQSSASTVRVGQRRRNRSGKVYEVLGIANGVGNCIEIDSKGQRMKSATFPLALSALIDMEIVSDAVAEIPEWITVGSVVIRDHDIAQYRYKGPVTSVEWDKGIKDYAVSLRWAGDGKIHGPYPASALRPDDGSEPRAENHYTPGRESASAEVDDGDDIYKNIFQHFKTGTLYRITSLLDDGLTVLAIEVDADGNSDLRFGVPERFRKNDLVLYQRVYANLPQTGTISAEAVNGPDDGFDDEDFDEAEDEISDHGHSVSLSTPTPQTPAPLNIYAEIYEHRRSGLLYRIKETRMNGDVDAVEVNERGEEISKYTRAIPSLDLKRYTPGTPRLPEPGLIPDTQELMLLNIYRGESIVKNAAIRGGLEDKGLITVTDRAGWQAEITENGVAYLLEHHLIAEAEDVQPAADETVDEEQTLIDDDDLPDWAVYGTTVQHTESGDYCDVVGSLRGLETLPDGTQREIWYLRVQIHGDDQADAPLRDFRFIDDAPAAIDPAAERHPALHPSNMTRLICEDQGLLNLVEQMAQRMGLDKTLSAVLRSAATTTADGLRTRQRAGGFDTTQADLDTQRAVVFATLNEFVRRYNGVYREESLVNYQIAQGA